jgi:voltage-gated potassium channel Kch
MTLLAEAIMHTRFDLVRKAIGKIGCRMLVPALLATGPLYAQEINRSGSPQTEVGVNEARISVERLLKLAEVDALAMTAAEKDVAALLARERVDMYITGVRDLGEGRDWCIYRQNVLPHEVIDRTMVALRALKGDALRGNAARATADVLTKQYPCKS